MTACPGRSPARATAALGLAPSLPAAIALGAVVGVANGVTVTVTGALVQTVADPRCLGGVTSVTTLCALGLAPVLFPAVGVTVAAWGAGVLFVGFGGICLLAAVVGLSSRALRHAELDAPSQEMY
jgi:hypothetical protein